MDGCPKNVHLVLMGYIRIVYHITTYRSTLFISFIGQQSADDIGYPHLQSR